MSKFEHQAFGWSPQPGPQDDLITCPLPEIFFGGARGGGKTDGVLGKWAKKERLYGQHFNAIMFRRTAVSAEDAIERSKEIYRPMGGRFNESKLRWRMPNGGRVSFAYLDTVADANVYQGRNVTDAWVEEAGQYPSATPIDRLFGILRSSHGVPVQLILTANPGGPGQHWIRQRYQIHPFPVRPQIMIRTLPNGKEHQVAVIPSRITDNKILLANDPGYVDRLQLVGSPQLVRAWLEGDWSAIEGAFFTEWDEQKHVLTPFNIPNTWMRFRSADWGSYSPFSVGWWAVATDDYAIGTTLPDDGAVSGTRTDLLGTRLLRDRDPFARGVSKDGRIIPRGALVRYREWYGEVGGKLTAEQVGGGIAEREKGDRARLSYGVLDPSAFIESGGPSIAERINRELINKHMAAFRAADNRRVPRNIGDPAKSGPMGGWDQMRARLLGVKGTPMLYVFNTCKDFIRTVPVLQHDETRSEDLDTEAEDHCADECFVEQTLIVCVRGYRQINNLRVGDLVATTIGWRSVDAVFSTGIKPVFRVAFSDGRELLATANHPIWVMGSGYTPVAELRYGNIMRTCAKPSYFRAENILAFLITMIGIGGFISGIIGHRYIGQSGRASTARLRRAVLSITSMATRSTTPLKIWLSWLRESILSIIGLLQFPLTLNVDIAGVSIRKKIPVDQINFVVPLAGRQAAVNPALMMKQELAASAEPNSPVTNTQSKNIARLNALLRDYTSARYVISFVFNAVDHLRQKISGQSIAPLHVVSVTPAGKQKVYNLSIAEAEEFYANGILVHNCRYACMSRPWVRAIPKTLLPPRDSYRPAHEERNDADSILLL